MKYIPPYVHPTTPIPRPVYTLWSVLEELHHTPIKMMWVGGRMSKQFGYYIPAVISYLPGVQHRLAIDFSGHNGTWVAGNRKRSLACANLGMEYMTIQRKASRAEMMSEIGAMVSQLKRQLEIEPHG